MKSPTQRLVEIEKQISKLKAEFHALLDQIGRQVEDQTGSKGRQRRPSKRRALKRGVIGQSVLELLKGATRPMRLAEIHGALAKRGIKSSKGGLAVRLHTGMPGVRKAGRGLFIAR